MENVLKINKLNPMSEVHKDPFKNYLINLVMEAYNDIGNKVYYVGLYRWSPANNCWIELYNNDQFNDEDFIGWYPALADYNPEHKTPSPMELLIKQLKEDHDLAWSFHCNVAMTIHDNYESAAIYLSDKQQCNNLSCHVMRNVFDFDIDKSELFQERLKFV